MSATATAGISGGAGLNFAAWCPPTADDDFATLAVECWDLRCVDVPTGGGDADVGWVVVEHHVAPPTEREIGFGHTPREAIAIARHSGKPKLRVLVCGGRNYSDRQRIAAILADFQNCHGPIATVIHGAAAGADTLAKEWAESHGQMHEPYPADWDNLDAPGAVVRQTKGGKLYNAKAGFDRNQKMVDEGKPDFCIAFPGGTGTADMVARAVAAGVPTYKIAD